MARIRTTGGAWVDMKIADLENKEVQVKRQMRNSMVEVPKGARGTVYTATPRWGLAIHFSPCRHCGCKAVMSKVHHTDILLVDPRKEG